MTMTFYAQPYDISATGFFFNDFETYAREAAAKLNAHGQRVEEYEIQTIDGDDIDVALASALAPHQGQLKAFFARLDDWDDDQKRRAVIAVSECGHALDLETDDPSDIDLDIYEMESMRELAEHFVDEGLFGEIPERLQFYIDFDAIARDLSVDYSETEIAGQRLVYRCG